MKETCDVDIAIIGAGIVGILTGIELKTRFPQKNILIIEKEMMIGHHTSSRNSGVLHSGIYYKTNSLKHLLCLEGYDLWIQLCQKFQIDLNVCGKYLIASSLEEENVLEKYYENALRNGVKGIQTCNQEIVNNLSAVVDISKALFSPHTAIMDVSRALYCFEAKFEALGGIIVKSSEVARVERLSKFQIEIDQCNILTDVLINCSGLESCSVDRLLGINEFDAYWVKGNYLKLTKKYYSNHLIYPVPLEKLIGLGVHTTFDLAGNVRFGPNVEPVSEVNYHIENELLAMKLEVIKKFKNIQVSDLAVDYCGIRPKVTKNEVLIEDFVIKKINFTEGLYIHLHGIESPGLTASPAIAKYVSKLISQ